MIGIYKIENLINGKIYIGQSVDIQERLSAHKRVNLSKCEKRKQTYPLYRAFKKYGIKNFSFTVLETIDSIDHEWLNNREKYWIKYYHSCLYDEQCNGYNLTFGGDGCKIIPQEEINLYIQLWNEGKSVGEIEKLMNRDAHAIIKYLKMFSNYTIQEGDRRGRKNSGIKHRKEVCQYDLFGNLIARFHSIAEANEITHIGMNSIINNAKHKTAMCYGFFFFYSEEDTEENLKKHFNLFKTVRPVIQFDINNNILNCFESVTTAKLFLSNFSLIQSDGGGSILPCCQGRTQSAYGYKWKFLEYEDIQKYNLKNYIIKKKKDLI